MRLLRITITSTKTGRRWLRVVLDIDELIMALLAAATILAIWLIIAVHNYPS